MGPFHIALAAVVLALAACSGPGAQRPAAVVTAPGTSPVGATPLASRTVPAAPMPPAGAQPQLASDPAQLADDLVADLRALRDPSTPEGALVAASHREQAALRAIGHNPDWDAITRPRIPPEFLNVYDRNIDARRQLQSMTPSKDTLPAWRIAPPAPADELMAAYHAAEAESGVAWNYLAAINFVETRFGSIVGLSTAGAQGPMQFLPSTFAPYGQGGDINSPRDSIMAAGRFLAANGFAGDHDHAVYQYNHAHQYVQAVDDYAALIASDPAVFPDYYRWDVYYLTTAGDVLLPIGYAESSRIPVGEYLAAHPQ